MDMEAGSTVGTEADMAVATEEAMALAASDTSLATDGRIDR